MASLSADFDVHRADFFELEYAASAAYNEFVYKDRAQADRVRTFLYDRGIAEFTPQYSRGIVENGRLAGFITRLSAQDLHKCRMKCSIAIGKSGAFQDDPTLFDRMRLAAGIMAVVEEGDYYISRLSVGKDFAGRGYAGLLMKHAQEEAELTGARRLTLELAADNLPAYNVYRKHGFEDVERRHAADPATGRSQTFIQMAKRL